jgi:predicted patatin/cPLA2 family phospholipase
MDLDWLWDITIRECRLDLDKIFRSLDEGGKEYIVTATALETGEPLYLKPDKSTLEHYIKISSSLPVLYRNILTAGEVAALDGGIADPVPVVEAYNRGARDITVIRSRPSGYVKEQGLVSVLYPYIFGKYPGLVRAMKKRHKVYMDAVRFINNPPDGVKVFEIAPPENLSIGRTTRNINSLNEAYIAGIKAGRRFVEAGIAVHEIT